MAKKEVNTSKEKKKEVKVKKHFFKDFKAELKKVIWPTPKQLVNNTSAVIVIVIITALLVAIFDLVFREANTYGIYKLQSIVDETFNKEENTNKTDDTDASAGTESDETQQDNGTSQDGETNQNGNTDINLENNTEQTDGNVVE